MMELQLQVSLPHRRSDRVSIAFPVEVSGIDLAGDEFCEEVQTAVVSRFGCSFSLARRLATTQVVFIRRTSNGERTEGSVVAHMDSPAGGYLYGISTPKSCERMWGISFSASLYETLLNAVSDGIYFVNRNRQITYWNASAERIAGYTSKETIGNYCFNNVLGHVDETGIGLCAKNCPLGSTIADGQPRQGGFYLRHKRGHRVPISARIVPIRNAEGMITGAAQLFSDSTEQKCFERRVGELEHLVFRDPLTGLPNRRYLELKLAQALQDHRTLGQAYGVLLFDLDRFKQVNDTHGHSAGDAVLKVVAETAVKSLRAGDMIGRWGGEEFLALTPDIQATTLGGLAERCRALIAQSWIIQDRYRISVTASIGCTLLDHKDCAESVLRRADELMYQSKRSGGDQATVG